MAITTTRFLLLLTTAKSPSPSILRLACHRRHFLPPLFSFSHRHFRSQSYSFPPLKIKASSSSSFSHHFHTQTAASPFPTPPQFSSQLLWPDFSHFVNNLSAAGYFSKQEGLGFQIDGFVPVDGLPDEFISAANACLAFARDRDYLLRKLSRRDVEVLVENGTAGLFDNGDGALRRMRVFLESERGGVLSSDSGTMIDLMKILLSCTSNLIYSENNNLYNREFLESSVRNLFSELAHLSCNAQEAIFSGSSQNKFSDSHGQISRPLRQNIEMKRGDWICPRCSFMNFARNMKCLECEEVRPKRQLTGGEWECPQCDFFNYGRNTMCLRCDCKRPGEVSLGITNSGSDLGYARDNYANNADIDKRLAENEEKAQRWFSKISQLDSTSDMSSAIADEDFPEIMPLRKGVNRFVVSTRKTPLERRLADAQYGRNSSNGGTLGINNAQSSASNDQTPRQALDDILGRKFAASDSNIKAVGKGQNSRTDTPNSVQQQYGAPRVSSSSYVPFVPLPADMFAKKPENVKTDESSKVEANNYRPSPSGVGEQMNAAFGSSENDKSGPGWLPLEMPADQSLSNDKEEKQNEQSDRWFKRVAELHNITDLATSIPDKESPEMMPMRKGENRFVVSKKKDRSLSSPTYKRRMAMEQANNTNYVPFVPFPPDYFAKKDTQQSDGANMTNKAMDVTSNPSAQANLSGKSDHIGDGTSTKAEMPVMENQQCSAGDWNSNSGKHLNQIRTGTTAATDPQFNVTNNQSSGFSWNDDNRGQRNVMANSHKTYSQAGGNNNISSSYAQNENFNQTGNSASTPQPPENQSSSNSWSGKSLEGSLVKEPDPLDMSEEAKAERWFRRVAQIKDISELSQIPDEDFPSIMPMRKGVNRFVVSKRKTPLERRLTSTQYRKNLPTVRSDPVKDNDST